MVKYVPMFDGKKGTSCLQNRTKGKEAMDKPSLIKCSPWVKHY